MKRSILIYLALTGLILLVSCSGSNDVLGFRETGTISGIVTDVATGHPIPGANAMISSSPFANDPSDTGVIDSTAKTGTDGFFTRSDVPVGEVKVVVTASGYKTPNEQVWALSPLGIGTFVFELTPGEDPPEAFKDNDDQNAWPPDYQPPGSGDE